MTWQFYCEDEGVSVGKLQEIASALEGFVETDVPLAIELILVDGEEIRRLNRETRNIDKVTDVLSYPALDGVKGEALCAADYPYEIDEEGNLLVGSIALCEDRAREQAIEYGHSLERELCYLIVHGVMHCLGYDHITEEERAEMREKEEYILRKMGVTREGANY